VLSGGEQQMLAHAPLADGRDPELDPHRRAQAEGLAPRNSSSWSADYLLGPEIAKRGVAVLLVEQKLTIALEISQRLRA
jgi:branched-chain amino acid transport system ATP-binding protein